MAVISMIPLHHITCGRVAFLVEEGALERGARASEVVLLNGRRPDCGTAVVCGSCGARLVGQALMVIPKGRD